MSRGRAIRDAASADFFDAAARGEFLLRRCRVDSILLDPKATCCPSCGSTDLAGQPAVGLGTVISWTVTHDRAESGADSTTVLAIVQLDEGIWWWSVVVGVDAGAVHAGLRVRIEFETSGGEDDEPLPVFRPI